MSPEVNASVAPGPCRLTVVVPVYNRPALLCRCLDSIYAQDYRPLKVVVVDNGSTDVTPFALSQWCGKHGVDSRPGAPFRLVSVEEHEPGAPAARNRGLREADTEWTLFFDSDDEMLPGHLARAMACAGPEADLVCWRADVLDLNGDRRPKPWHTSSWLRRQVYNCVWSTQCYMARTSLFRSVGGWNTDAVVWNDWELGIRLALARPRVHASPHTGVLVHAQADSITGRRFADRAGEREHTVGLVDALPQWRGDLPRLTAYVRAVLAARYRREGLRREAAALMETACSGLPRKDALMLRAIHAYTFLGGRGGYLLWDRP